MQYSAVLLDERYIFEQMQDPKDGSLAQRIYNMEKVLERHRHRYEVNPAIVPILEAAGLQFVGRNTDSSGERMEVIELDTSLHPYFVAAQFHPEFTSRPKRPIPLFFGLLKANQRGALETS